MIEGDSLEQLGEPEVLFQDPATSALSELIELKVDTGLSWPSARRYLHEALRDPLVKSTEFGGTTGFWRQQRSNRLVLAVELPTSSADRSRRMHRILRPTMHTSLKPQYVPAPQLRTRYATVRDLAEAEREWGEAHAAEEASRVKKVWLLCGAILPLWSALTETYRAKRPAASRRGGELSMIVKKVVLADGIPRIGVALTEAMVLDLKERLKERAGGSQHEIDEATRRRDEQRGEQRQREAREAKAREAKAKEAKHAAARGGAAHGGGGRGGGGGGGGERGGSEGGDGSGVGGGEASIGGAKAAAGGEKASGESSEEDDDDDDDEAAGGGGGLVFASGVVSGGELAAHEQADDEEEVDDLMALLGD